MRRPCAPTAVAIIRYPVRPIFLQGGRRDKQADICGFLSLSERVGESRRLRSR
jgi:hypothetical protein